MKKLLISHDDLDGVSPVILMKLANISFDYQLVAIPEIDEVVKNYLNQDLSQYEKIYITDICPNEELTKQISEREDKEKFMIFDHHASRSFLKNYDFATLNTKECGTSLFYNYLKEQFNLNKPIYETYVSLVLDIDMWYWKEKGNFLAKQLSDLLSIYGQERFIEKMYQKLLEQEKFTLSEFEQDLLEIEQERINRYIEKKEKDMMIIQYQEKKAGVVFAEKYQSEMGNILSEKYSNLDYIIMINPNKGISLRTEKEDIDLSVISSKLGGGGHKKASGIPFPEELKKYIITAVFKDSIIIEDKYNSLKNTF